MKKIPLHCLVLMVGPSHGGKTTLAASFSSHEVLSDRNMRIMLTGQEDRRDITDAVFREINRLTQTKLELGERVVIDAANLRRRDRLVMADMATKMGLPVFYLVCDRDLPAKLLGAPADKVELITRQDHTFRSAERDILKGDGVANVIDTRRDDHQVVKKLDGENLIQQVRDLGFRGVTVMGDVHGMIQPLKNATEWATQRNLFCVFLGDVLDYGPGSLECVDHVYDIVTRGRGISLIGNHERKIDRWLEQVRRGDVRVRLSEGNKVTTRAIEALGGEARRRFEIKFRALMNLSRHHWIMGDTLFAHGAADVRMFSSNSHRLDREMENLALFGEVDQTSPQRSDGYPNRIYEWVNRIPKGKRVMVGHDIRSTLHPLVVQGDQGGEAYFMDTGSGKGGCLTSADASFEDDQLVIKNFKSH